MANITATNVGTAATQPGSGGFDPFGWAFGGSDRQGGSLTSLFGGNGNDPGLLGLGVRDVHSTSIDPNAGYYNTGPQDQWRDQQQTLASLYAQQAAGNGPSLAQGQLQQATDRNMQQAMALGASQRGAGTAGGLKSIFDHQSQIGSQMASDSALLRLQEQMAARNALGGILNAGRGQDMGVASAQQQGNLGYQGLMSGNNLGYEQLRQGAYGQAGTNRGSFFDKLSQLAASGAKVGGV